MQTTQYARVSVVDYNEQDDTLLCDVVIGRDTLAQSIDIPASAFYQAFSTQDAQDARTVALGALYDAHFDACPRDLVGASCVAEYRAHLLAQ
jgi:hypothetical protein